jgi:hypothetical protein
LIHWSHRIPGERCVLRHAVNSQQALARFIASDANLAEGDVLLGALDPAGETDQPIMAHPPATRSDLSFDHWVAAAVSHGHALKVDLKAPAVIEPALGILDARRFDGDRLIFNADVIVGPGGEPPLFGLDHLRRCREAFPGAALSLGCTTGPRGGPYREETVQRLIEAARELGPLVTVALRAEAVLADDQVLHRIGAAGLHVSIWNEHTAFAVTREQSRDFRRRLPEGLLDLLDVDGHPV